MLFQSDTLNSEFMRPAIFHGFSGSKTQWSSQLKSLASQGMVTLLETLLGTESSPPLWQAPRSCKFAVGSCWQTRHRAGVLSADQVNALRSVWSRDLFPELPNGIWHPYSYVHEPMQGSAPVQPLQSRRSGRILRSLNLIIIVPQLQSLKISLTGPHVTHRSLYGFGVHGLGVVILRLRITNAC